MEDGFILIKKKKINGQGTLEKGQGGHRSCA